MSGDETETDDALVPEAPRDRKVASVVGANGKVQKIKGKLLRALLLMTWGDEEGRPVDWEKAAPAVGMRTRSLRRALAKPHVRQFIRHEKRLALDAFGAANPAVARQLRDTADNSMVRFRAMQFLEGPASAAEGSERPGVTPGVVVRVNVNSGPRVVDETIIEVNPGGGVPDLGGAS